MLALKDLGFDLHEVECQDGVKKLGGYAHEVRNPGCANVDSRWPTPTTKHPVKFLGWRKSFWLAPIGVSMNHSVANG